MILLTESDVARFQQMRSQAAAGQIAYWQIYEALADLLQNQYGIPSTDSTVLWLRGATEANAGRGTFSALIRTYTQTQYQLRYGATLPDGKMQQASNAVAENLLRDLLGDNDLNNSPVQWPSGQVPDINRIALADARAVGSVLFNADLGDTAAELQQNAAWSGTLLFSLLGSDQTLRLTSAGPSPTKIDSLNDWRDVLFAAVSFQKAIASAAAIWLTQDLDQQGIDAGVLGPTLISQIASGTPALDIWDTLMQGATGVVGEAFAFINRFGPEKLLDMLMGARSASVQIGVTTSANFDARAHQFFAGFSAVELQSLITLQLPTDAAGLTAFALQDSPHGLAARAALAALSPIAVTVDLALVSALSLQNPSTGQGQLSEQWVRDRAAFTLANLQKLQGLGGNVQGSQNIHYRDAGSKTDVLVGSGSWQRIQVLFGGAGADTLNGQGFADRLYGAIGTDTLTGLGGDDHLEGGADNDTLDGGAGSDTLLGGAGQDTYLLDGSAGQDVIVDPDGGLILYQGQPLTGGAETSPGSRE